MKSSGGGEIVQVQGGHILRSTGRKDRHSKVYTAKGPRDRRVRLSAHTAIQFYDVQDRLGYDRPSKAVDWLINKAKNAIDKLAELPPWNPYDTPFAPSPAPIAGSSGIALGQQSESSSGYAFHQHRQLGENPSSGSSFIPCEDDTQSIADRMKLFLPTSSGTSSMNFQNYPHNLLSRNSIQTEDLCLSLHSLQDPNSSRTPPTDQSLFSGSCPVTFELNYPRIVGWNSGADAENRGAFIFNSQAMPQQSLLCQSSAFSQGEPLQSSYSHLVRAWDDPPLPSADHQSSISRSQFASEKFTVFQVPARIHGEEELGVVSNRPPSDSPNSHH